MVIFQPVTLVFGGVPLLFFHLDLLTRKMRFGAKSGFKEFCRKILDVAMLEVQRSFKQLFTKDYIFLSTEV